MNNNDLIQFDKAKANGFRFLIGTDEAGRGPLAGPVVAAAVCIRDSAFVNKIGDSKALSALQRNRAFHEIFDRAWVGIGLMNEKIIDDVNILKASHLAMTAAVRELCVRMPGNMLGVSQDLSEVKILVDGNSFASTLDLNTEMIVKGDAKSLAIASASIVAKVYRDRLMEKYDHIYPGYDFAKHKGYPTKAHCLALHTLGLSPIHRRTFHSSAIL